MHDYNKLHKWLVIVAGCVLRRRMGVFWIEHYKSPNVFYLFGGAMMSYIMIREYKIYFWEIAVKKC